MARHAGVRVVGGTAVSGTAVVRPLVRPGAPTRAGVLWSAAVAAVVGLLHVLAPTSLGGLPAPGATAPVHGPSVTWAAEAAEDATPAAGPRTGTTPGTDTDTRERARGDCSVLRCGVQPRLLRDGPGERSAAPSGTAPIPSRLRLDVPVHGAATPSPPDVGISPRRLVTGHDGRAPPASPGI